MKQTLFVPALIASLVGIFAFAPMAFANKCDDRGESTLILNEGKTNEEVTCYTFLFKADWFNAGAIMTGVNSNYDAVVAIDRSAGSDIVSCVAEIDDATEELSDPVDCTYVASHPRTLAELDYDADELIDLKPSRHIGHEQVAARVFEETIERTAQRKGEVVLTTEEGIEKKGTPVVLRAWTPAVVEWKHSR